MSSEGGNKAIIAALGANLGIAITKLIAFALTGMSSMLAEGIHSLADSGNQLLLLIGGRRAKKAATPEHPFGYGRERYVFGFVVSIVLFSLGGLFALYEAYHKAHEAHAGEGERPGFGQDWWWVPVVVLLAAIVLEGLSFRTAVRESHPHRGDSSWLQFIRRAKAPELPVILLEDFAALVGLVFALFGVVLSVLTRSSYWDAAGTGLIGLLLVAVAVVLAIETKSLLVGESASPSVARAIVAAIEGAPGVDRVIHAKTLHLGPEELLVAAKIAVGAADTGAQVTAAINSAEERARASAPDLRLVMYLEPDLDASPVP
ncbi:cation diffusion facilitator family transporter [Allobranchiibius sp. GilTou38]|uniref:cation diffusion facilitator family transporter n=1 Tax=Allobranchiibius sp. GilTou38 TaxID=2815210 RepID=UPI001AA0D2F3|nr:cation diffusion facilitator family transporter [Allobranchiibius sp. GilTou38]MBO1765678.1 cation diffusion facilitator family transporter [Allobranchiibius sp. GilTou38]